MASTKRARSKEHRIMSGQHATRAQYQTLTCALIQSGIFESFIHIFKDVYSNNT